MAASLQPEPVSFADVYDVLYDDAGFRAAQITFLGQVFGPPPACLLDAGCGTGAQLCSLAAAGYSVAGLDADLRMLHVARRKLSAAGHPATLILGDLRTLPFELAFDGILCLESPLAYLLADDDLAGALAEFHRCLRSGGRLVLDVFDYPGTLGEEGLAPQTTRFRAPWGSVVVQEEHSYAPASGIWTMRQGFRVKQAGRVSQFGVTHQLRMRSVESYVAVLEGAGFVMIESRSAYPEVPTPLADERRTLLVAQTGR